MSSTIPCGCWASEAEPPAMHAPKCPRRVAIEDASEAWEEGYLAGLSAAARLMETEYACWTVGPLAAGRIRALAQP